MSSTTHLIEEFKVRADTILCCCEWFGKTEDFRAHQKSSPPTHKKPNKLSFDDQTAFMARRRVTIDDDYVKEK